MSKEVLLTHYAYGLIILILTFTIIAAVTFICACLFIIIRSLGINDFIKYFTKVMRNLKVTY